MSYPSFRSLEKAILIGLLEYYHESDDGEYLQPSKIREVCGLTISNIMLSKVIESLSSRDLITFSDYEEDGYYYALSLKGIESAERAAGSQDLAAKVISTIPASDRLVSIDDNSRNEATEAIDQALEIIRVSNSVAPDKKSWLTEHLNAGKTLLKAKQITTQAIRSLLVQPLYSAWKSVGEETGKQALLAIIRVIKTLVGWN